MLAKQPVCHPLCEEDLRGKLTPIAVEDRIQIQAGVVLPTEVLLQGNSVFFLPENVSSGLSSCHRHTHTHDYSADCTASVYRKDYSGDKA